MRKFNLFLTEILPKFDLVLAYLLYLPARFMKAIRARGINHFPRCRQVFLKIGVFPILDHFYDPLFNEQHLKKPLTEPRILPGIEWNDQSQLDLLEQFHYNEELTGIKMYKEDDETFHFNNNVFDAGDAETWYNMIRWFQPKCIIEIGSGYSTLMAIKAIKRNKHEDHGYQCQHICIEPYLASWLEHADVTVIRKPVEDVELELFSSLQPHDLVFIDSSHIIRPQGDVLYEYFRILPVLAGGVIVHIHDIFSPRDYLTEWIVEEKRLWNEQYLLEALLMSNPEWRIMAALNYLSHSYYAQLKATCPFLAPTSEPRSFYIRKVG
ncbi:hypothetical protein U27_02144 [Candidatus Vecturithrix granuli]|uniref:Class I SAM-dependent methyltransferase n=1 Tax=Vecturithrix granuli TaxID=1499967 RepID=A0A0S6W6N6_VECG1|nr:hypothetical protein U27_02144 [Candidatus Vecturithrix granuli]